MESYKCKWCSLTSLNNKSWDNGFCCRKCKEEYNKSEGEKAAQNHFKRNSQQCSFCNNPSIDGVNNYLSNGSTYRSYYFCSNSCTLDYRDKLDLTLCDDKGFSYTGSGRESRKKYDYSILVKNHDEKVRKENVMKSARESAFGSEEDYYKNLTNKLKDKDDKGGSWWNKLFN